VDLKKIEKLMELMRTYGVRDVEVEDGQEKVKLSHGSSGGTQTGYGFGMMPSQGMSMPMSMAPMMTQAMSAAATAPGEPSAKSAGKTPGAGQKMVKSPFVGTFYRSPSPDADPFVEVGKRVKVGDSLCIIEAMKLMNEIESDAEGTVVEIMVNNGEPVEFDQPLFILE